jgi:hypothetical protein
MQLPLRRGSPGGSGAMGGGGMGGSPRASEGAASGGMSACGVATACGLGSARGAAAAPCLRARPLATVDAESQWLPLLPLLPLPWLALLVHCTRSSSPFEACMSAAAEGRREAAPGVDRPKPVAALPDEALVSSDCCLAMRPAGAGAGCCCSLLPVLLEWVGLAASPSARGCGWGGV